MLLAAVTFYVGVYNFLIFIRRPRDREYLTLAACCLFFGMYDLCCALLYGVSTPTEGGIWQRRQGVALALATASFSWFVFYYLEEAARFPARTKTIVAVISAVFVLTAVLLVAERSGLYWIMDRPLVKTARLPFGFTVVYNEVAPGPLSNLQSLMGFVAYACLFGMIVHAYRSGARKRAVSLISVMSLFFLAMINDTAVSGGWYPFVYVMEYAYMVMVLHVTNSLTMKVVQSAVAQEALRASDARFRGFVETSNDWIWEVDARGIITYSSPKVFDLLGYAPGDVVGKDARDYISPTDSTRLREGSEAWLSSPAPIERIEYVCLRKDGGSVVMETNAIPLIDSHGACTGYRGIARDVTRRKAAEVERARLYQTLRDSEEKHRTLFEQAMDAIILHGADGTILDANERACRLLGYSRDELLRLNVADIAAPGSPLGAESAASGRRMEGEYLTRGGARVPVEASIALLTVAGKPVVSVIAHDITPRRRVEEQLRQAQKMEAVGALAGGVAHDFNNILTAILGYATLLRQEVPVGSQLYEDVEAVAGSARRAAELTRQLLTFSRRAPQDEMKPVDMHEIIREVESLLARTIDKSIVVETALEARAHTVEGISGQLHQALLNLCLNARDAMPMGGRLRIQTGTSAPPHTGRGKAGRLTLSVSDTGTGMTQEVRDHLFEPFFTTKESGRGLGLAMVYGIVRGHGGRIVVQSRPGAGSVFEIDLPLTRRSAKKETAAGESLSRRRGSETVLVVDDEKTVRSVLTRILERNGYSVILAEDGAVGVEKYKENRGSVDLVILDIAMPRMNGNEAYDALMAINPKLKVLVSSGYSEEDRVADLIGKGANGFLRKPYANETVLAAVRDVLDS